MKVKCIIVVIAALISLNVVSQTKLNFGVNFSDANFKNDNNESVNYKPQLGFRLGLDHNLYDISDLLSLETGLTITLNRFKIDDLGLDHKFYNLSIGTHLLANFKLLDDKFIIGAGPNVFVGLIGKQKQTDGTTYDLYKGNDLQDDAPLKRLDLGVELKASYKVDLVSFINDVYISYRQGLSNIENSEAASGIDQSATTSQLSFGVRMDL